MMTAILPLVPVLADLERTGTALACWVVLLIPCFVVWALIDGFATNRLCDTVEILAERQTDEEDEEALRKWLTTTGRRIVEKYDETTKFSKENLDRLARLLSESQDDLGPVTSARPVGLPSGPAPATAPMTEASANAMALFNSGGSQLPAKGGPPLIIDPDEIEFDEGGEI